MKSLPYTIRRTGLSYTISLDQTLSPGIYKLNNALPDTVGGEFLIVSPTQTIIVAKQKDNNQYHVAMYDATKIPTDIGVDIIVGQPMRSAQSFPKSQQAEIEKRTLAQKILYNKI
jgi:hypothetical protein